MKLNILETKNGDQVFISNLPNGKISIMINDGDGTGEFTPKEAKELIEMIRKALLH